MFISFSTCSSAIINVLLYMLLSLDAIGQHFLTNPQSSFQHVVLPIAFSECHWSVLPSQSRLINSTCWYLGIWFAANVFYTIYHLNTWMHHNVATKGAFATLLSYTHILRQMPRLQRKLYCVTDDLNLFMQPSMLFLWKYTYHSWSNVLFLPMYMYHSQSYVLLMSSSM